MTKILYIVIVSIMWNLTTIAFAQEKYSLTVNATPSDSRIRIMNIGPKYFPSIKLKPGNYDILVEKSGYLPNRQWIRITNQDVIITVVLEKPAVNRYSLLDKLVNWFTRNPIKATSGFTWPLPYRFSNNGGYTFAAYKKYPGGYVYHPGQDWNVPNSPGGSCNGDKGLNVVAVANGKVVYVNHSSWGGLVIQHNYKGNTWYSQYGHVQKIVVSTNESVKKGQKVAEIGKVGTRCAHLHFEIRQADHPDPTYGPYWKYGNSGLNNLINVNDWYENPATFIPKHPAYND
jgi:murein DD-endopeptidase MepM/ murein hydrolase activator NlpD